MNRKLVALSRVPAAVAAAALVVVLAGCTEAARTTKDVAFPTADLSVALVQTLTEGMPMAAVTLPEATAGSDTLTYSVTPEVPGLSFNPATRVYSGTPTAAGSYTLTYTATTSGGESASLMFTVEVVSSFRGTWRAHHEWWEDDDVVGTYIDTLTFTKSRYILHRAHYRTEGMAFNHADVSAGTWEYTDTTLTRIWMHNDDDLDETPDVLTRVPKKYLWNDDRTTLCVQHWLSDREEFASPQCDRHERVTRVPSLAGMWTGDNEFENDDNGETVHQVFNLAFESDNSFRFGVEYTGGYEEVFSIAGTWASDPDRDFGFLVTVESVFKTVYGEPEDLSHWSGQVLRWSYAPTDNANKIQVSVYWNEHGWDADQHQHTDDSDPRHPYGNYWLTMTRAAN
ncbi:MAG: Ig domain-containing protein, partial [Spirochaetaceae bacterium]|nr:Ig domain-containing protein [Spirochaetaceae bacterium]